MNRPMTMEMGTAAASRARVSMAYFHSPKIAKYMTVPPESMASFQPLSAYPRMKAITISAVQGGVLSPKPLDPPRRMLSKMSMRSLRRLETNRVTTEKPRSSRMNSNVESSIRSMGTSSVYSSLPASPRVSMLLFSRCCGSSSRD